MYKTNSFSQAVGYITDNKSDAVPIVKELSEIVSTKMISWDVLDVGKLNRVDILVFDVNLADKQNLMRLKMLIGQGGLDGIRIFSTDTSNRTAVAQMNALGAHHIIARPINSAQLVAKVANICNQQNNSPEVARKKAGEACLAISDTMDAITAAARKGGQLPLNEISNSCESIIGTVADVDLKNWMSAVRVHSSHTYRHVMVTAGFSSLFGVKFGMAHRDIERLTLGAILHDVGKVKIPARILDKTSKLNPRELKIMQQHPLKGYEMLAKDGNFSDEVLMIARSHHEYLDGSGYPDQLRGRQIPDVVRIMTVVDIFSALVDSRSYKTSVSMQVAYDMLRNMGRKLDQDIVRGFEPIALDEGNHELFDKVHKKMVA